MVISQNSLSTSASHRRRSSTSSSGWHCPYCKKTFVLEKAFMSHQCKEKKRVEEIKTPLGQAAYQYYAQWMRLKKMKAPSIDTFITSRYYLSFIKFATFIQKLSISYPDAFMKLMVLRDIGPVLWCRDQTYTIYLEWIDKNEDPYQLVLTSIEILEKIAQQEKLDFFNIFNNLGYKRVLEFIRLRNISPWLLLHSDKFKQFLMGLENDETSLLMGIINVQYWSKVLSENTEVSKELVLIVKEIGL